MSLFSNTQTGSATDKGGLFGTSQSQPRSNLFGSSTNVAPGASSQPPAASSLLGQQQQQQQQQQNGISSPSQPAFFSSLLERSKKRPLPANSGSDPTELPSLQLGIDGLRSTARGLSGPGRKMQVLDPSEKKAHTSLAASGITPTQIRQKLTELDVHASAKTPSRSIDTFDPDNQKFLRQIQQRGREALVADSLMRVRDNFNAFLEDRVNLNWEEQRQKIYEHFGLMGERLDTSSKSAFGRTAASASNLPGASAASSRRSVFGRSGLEKSIIGTPGAGPNSSQNFFGSNREDGSAFPADTRVLRERISNFALTVRALNESRLQGKQFPVIHEFMAAEKLSGGNVPRDLIEAYLALISITAEKKDMSGPISSQERQFSSIYLNEVPNSEASIRLKTRIIEGSRGFLEKRFSQDIETLVARHPREAQLGGIPSVTNKIRAYIRLRASRKDLAPDGTELQMIGDDYCWILIFYLLRCGYVKQAAEYVSQDPGFRSMDHKFVTYMATYARNRRLPRDLQQKINGEYQQRLRNAPEGTVDPYRMACYKVIGRCDLAQRRFESIGQSVEDWMWLQFAFAREDNRVEEVAGDVFGLEEIQQDFSDIGQKVFSKGQESGYATFFLLQILGGMFEQAVAYLGSYVPVTAVHFAIALDFYGLMRVSDFYASRDELLSFSTKELPQINFAYLITQYTRDFRTGDVEAAVDYFTLICLNSDLPGELGKSQSSVCYEALREFILESRDFSTLLGDVRPDGTRIKGAIEQRLKLIKPDDQEDFLKSITIQAAAVADDKGLVADAILLYHLAEDYDRVITIINRTLSDVIAVDLGAATPRLQSRQPPTDAASQNLSLNLVAGDDPVELAKNMIGLYSTNAAYYQKIHQFNREASGVLLRTIEAKSKVQAGNWTQALDEINNLQILPLRAQGSIPYIRSAAQAFSALPPVVARNAGQLIMWSIVCVAQERERLARGVFENDMRTSLADQLLVMAKDLMVFAGMIKYKLAPRVYETLARAGGEIGL